MAKMKTFVYDIVTTIAERVYVEAESKKEAEEILDEGIYDTKTRNLKEPERVFVKTTKLKR